MTRIIVLIMIARLLGLILPSAEKKANAKPLALFLTFHHTMNGSRIWKTALLLSLCVFLSGCLSNSEDNSQGNGNPSPIDLPGWRLVWHDEFDGTSLDESSWDYQTGDGCDIGLCGWGNNELQWYQKANVQVSGGFLKITARKEEVSGHPYTSARIRTAHKQDWTYGRFEVRARLPRGKGLWPAIWMLPTNNVYGGWAASGEIDIMEMLGHEPNKIYGSLHFGGPAPQNQHVTGSYTLPSGTFSDSFHVFALEWEASEIRWYVDGIEYFRFSDWWSSGGPYPAPFNQPFHLLLNVAVGGNWPGNPDATTTFPQTMEVDYVRVYRKAGSSN
ncbi:MAG: glycoside hydrolase family 16 protein, partial [Calditrichaeota bacterium]